MDEILSIVKSDCGFGSWKNIAVSIWHGQLTLAHIPMLRNEWTAVQRASRDGFGVITIVTPEAPMVAPDARKPLSELYESFGQTLKGASVVVQASGMKGTAARMIISTLQLVARPPYPMDAHDSIKHGAEWLQSKVGQVDAAKALETLFSSYEQRRTS